MKEKIERNKEIKKQYKIGLGGIIGRAQNPPISRQRINYIVRHSYNTHQTCYNGFWGVFWSRLIKYITGGK